jgi:hypothetical protein
MRVIKPTMYALCDNKNGLLLLVPFAFVLQNYFWGNSSTCTYLELKKRLIRVMSGLRPREPCRGIFRDWRILPLQSQYIFLIGVCCE